MEQAKKAEQADAADLGFVADLFYRQYDILHRLTTQMLATRNIDDKLSLVLDAVTSELGYAHSALGLIDEESGAPLLPLAHIALGFAYYYLGELTLAGEQPAGGCGL